jgi:hypothetical protein
MFDIKFKIFLVSLHQITSSNFRTYAPPSTDTHNLSLRSLNVSWLIVSVLVIRSIFTSTGGMCLEWTHLIQAVPSLRHYSGWKETRRSYTCWHHVTCWPRFWVGIAAMLKDHILCCRQVWSHKLLLPSVTSGVGLDCAQIPLRLTRAECIETVTLSI